ncbi:hypothetical protein BC833DRAFT_527115 [Globomyces pollinis-pini]|nr:hypothetical protein BC833DRAFT_527115 [Globomyces pollinis-pini]
MSSIIDTPARRIKVYRNGDIYHAGKKMIVPYHTRNFEQFLSECSQDVNLVNGGVRRLFNVHGKRIKSLDDILDSESYVATGGEPFKNVDYLLQEENIPPVFKGYSRSNLPILRDNSTISTTSQQLVRRKVNRSNGGLLIDEPKFPPPTSGMFNATTKAFKVVVFENGEANNEGIRLILNHRNCKTFEQLLKFLSSLKLLKSGQVRKIYDVKTGQKLKTLKDLVHGQNLALSSFDYFKKVNYKFIDVTTNTTQTKKEPDVIHLYLTPATACASS